MMSLISSQNDRKKEVQEGGKKNDLIPLLLIKYWNNFLNLLQI